MLEWYSFVYLVWPNINTTDLSNQLPLGFFLTVAAEHFGIFFKLFLLLSGAIMIFWVPDFSPNTRKRQDLRELCFKSLPTSSLTLDFEFNPKSIRQETKKSARLCIHIDDAERRHSAVNRLTIYEKALSLGILLVSLIRWFESAHFVNSLQATRIHHCTKYTSATPSTIQHQ